MTDFDLTPDPRVLQMLGEINLEQWKCVAELIDNAIDGFAKARAAGVPVATPQIAITLPVSNREDGFVTVRDNGPGMDAETLQNAVRAGWSGNNPFDSLGLFGMGFNIATARLGLVTEVWTSRAGDAAQTGLRIDLDDLRRSRRYHTPQLSRPKSDHGQHGTEIVVRALKPEQRAFFAKSANLQKIKSKLRQVYAPLLDDAASAFRLEVNGASVQPQRFCHWDPSRSSPGPDGVTVYAAEPFDFTLEDRVTCGHCMTVFTGAAPSCPQCGETARLSVLKRRVHGWVGLQRYLDESDYGIDLVRNGRVIEVRSKELFSWSDGQSTSREYPIDDQRNRGRFVGRVHIDHCRVSYTKDRFEREDPSWADMVRLVRGDGPLQPQKAALLGYSGNNSPLYRLFQAYRRTSPQGKSGRWSRILVVKDNELARQMAEEFDKGDPAYQTDEAWWRLVQEQDDAIVGGGASALPSPTAPVPAGFLDAPAAPAEASIAATTDRPLVVAAPPVRHKALSLSRVYEHPLLRFRFPVDAFAAEPGDPELPSGTPWTFRMDDPATGTYVYLFDPRHDVFRSETMTPLDALLIDIARMIIDFVRDQPGGGVASLGGVLSQLRARYAAERNLSPSEVMSRAQETIRDLAGALATRLDPPRAQEIFDMLPEEERGRIRRRIAAAGFSDYVAVIRSGTYLEHAEPATIAVMLERCPDLFFDGNYWEERYATLDFGDSVFNDAARRRVLNLYLSYLMDAEWLTSLSPSDFDRSPRDRIVRAAQSLRLLRADADA